MHLWFYLCDHNFQSNFSPYVVFFFKQIFLKSSFRFIAKLSGRYRDFPLCPLLTTPNTLSCISDFPRQSGAFVPVSEPTLRHHHPKSIVHITVYSWWCTFYASVDLDKGIHHCGVTQKSCTALKILCAPHSSVLSPLATTDFLLSAYFCLSLKVTQLEAYSMWPFQSGFFHLVTCICFLHVFSRLDSSFLFDIE